MREEKWKSRLDRDPKQFIVLVATDAMRLAMLKPTKNFPPSVVIAWLSTVAATKPSAGRVGVPKDGERVCWQCKGAGKTGPGPFDGCDRCAGTGVLKARKPKLTALEAAGQ